MAAVIAISAVVGVLRFALPASGAINKQDIYKDAAHLWVGGVIGAALASGQWQLWAVAGCLSALELIAFAVRKKR